jgi:phospholipase C
VPEKDSNTASEHPPANVCAGNLFLQTIWSALVDSPAFKDTLFIVNFDKHGGCPDHVPSNWTAVSPDNDSNPGNLDFNVNRYGVRVPAIFASPYIIRRPHRYSPTRIRGTKNWLLMISPPFGPCCWTDKG